MGNNIWWSAFVTSDHHQITIGVSGYKTPTRPTTKGIYDLRTYGSCLLCQALPCTQITSTSIQSNRRE